MAVPPIGIRGVAVGGDVGRGDRLAHSEGDLLVGEAVLIEPGPNPLLDASLFGLGHPVAGPGRPASEPGGVDHDVGLLGQGPRELDRPIDRIAQLSPPRA